jgi:hypothetical protein
MESYCGSNSTASTVKAFNETFPIRLDRNEDEDDDEDVDEDDEDKDNTGNSSL